MESQFAALTALFSRSLGAFYTQLNMEPGVGAVRTRERIVLHLLTEATKISLLDILDCAKRR